MKYSMKDETTSGREETKRLFTVIFTTDNSYYFIFVMTGGIIKIERSSAALLGTGEEERKRGK